MTSEKPWIEEAREAAKQTAIEYINSYSLGDEYNIVIDGFMLGAKWHEKWMLDQLAQAVTDKRLIPS